MAQADDAQATTATADPAFTWTRLHTVVLVVLCLAQLLELIDISVVNLALPTIKSDLGFSESDLQWVVNAYTVLFGGFLLLGGRAGDILGSWRVFQAGLLAFTAASLASGLAQNAGTLVGTRAAQGLAAAFVSPMTLAIIASMFPEGRYRNRALGIWGATAGISTAIGVIAGGLIVDGLGWRWIFFINIPIGLGMLAATFRFVTSDRPTRAHHNFDAVGAVAITGGLSLLSYTVVQTDTHPWGSGRTIALLVVSALLIGYFAFHELRVASEPLVPLSLFRIRSVRGANSVQALFGAAMIAMLFLVSLYQQQVLGFSPLKAGLGSLPLTVALVLFAPVGPLLLPKIGMRSVVLIGSAVATAGLLLFATRISPDGGLLSTIIVPGIVLGAGLALLFIPLTVAAVAGVPESQHGIASGVLNMTRTVGGAIGLAAISTLAADRTAHRLGAGRAPLVALTDGFRVGFTVCAVLMGISALTALVAFRTERSPEPAGTAPVLAAAEK